MQETLTTILNERKNIFPKTSSIDKYGQCRIANTFSRSAAYAGMININYGHGLIFASAGVLHTSH